MTRPATTWIAGARRRRRRFGSFVPSRRRREPSLRKGRTTLRISSALRKKVFSTPSGRDQAPRHTTRIMPTPGRPASDGPHMSRIPRSVFFLLFTVSGFAGLVYESIWSHYLKLFLGHAAYAQTLVLALFMGGMAIGSWFCSRWSGGWGNLLRGYALAEGLIGLAGLGFHRSEERRVGKEGRPRWSPYP